MKLCRFELTDDPGVTRSGIFFENRIYETHGEKAIGIHELSKIALLPPVGRPFNVRVFDENTYKYAQTSTILGPLSEFEIPSSVTDLTIQPRLAGVLHSAGEQIEASEATSFYIGVTNFVQFIGKDQSGNIVSDLPFGIGPFLHSLDEFDLDDSKPLELGSLQWELIVNDRQIYASEETLRISFSELLPLATKTSMAEPGDLIVSEALPLPPLSELSLERFLRPGDVVQVNFAKLGVLTLKLT